MKQKLVLKFTARMKTLSGLFFLLLGFTFFPAQGQENVKIQLSKSDFLYRNSENPATVTVPGAAQKDIKVTLSDGSINSDSKGYNFIPGKVGTAVVSVFVKGKLLKKAEFKVINVAAKLNGHKSGDITKALILPTAKMAVEVEGPEVAVKFKLVSYEVSAMIDGNEVTIKSSGEALNPDQINLLKKLQAGDRFMISDIKVMGSDGTQRTVADLVFDLK